MSRTGAALSRVLDGAGFCLLGPWPRQLFSWVLCALSHQVALGEPAPPTLDSGKYQLNVPQCQLQHRQLLHNYFCLKFRPICYLQGVGGASSLEGSSLEDNTEGVRLHLVWASPGLEGQAGP